MAQEYGYKLGSFRGYESSLHVSASPSLENAEEFTVTVYYSLSSSDNVEIARIDTAHGYTHFDRLYRRDRLKDPVSWDWDEAEVHLRSNWRRYAERYDDVYGL